MDEIIMTISAVSLGITAVFSEAGLPSRYKPLASLIIGVGVAVVIYGLSRDVALMGIIGSLMASGFWSGVKAVRKSEPLG